MPETTVAEDLSSLGLQDQRLVDVLKTVQLVYVQPQAYYRRIIETIHLQDSSVIRTVTMEMRLPGTQRIYLPVLRPKKTALVDNLTIEEAPGVSPWTLNRREAKLLTSGLVQYISLQRVSAARGVTVATRPTFDESQALKWLGRLATSTSDTSRFKLQILRRLALGMPPDEEPMLAALGQRGQDLIVSAARDRRVMRTLSELADQRLMFVPVSPTDSVQKVTFSFESPHFEHVRSDWKVQIRGLFGFTPYDFRFDADHALLTPSYHFRLRGPDHHYVRAFAQSSVSRISVRVVQGRLRANLHPVPLEPAPDWVEGVSGTATNYAHIYFRDLYLKQIAAPQIRATINERPGGTIGGAAFHSGLTLLVAVILWRLTRVPPAIDKAQPQGMFNVDAGALLTALPALAAFTLRPSRPDSEYVVAPLTSRIAVVTSVICSLSVALLTLADGVYVSTPQPIGLGVAWAVALFIAAVTFVWSLVRLLINSVRFNRLDRRRDGISHYSASRGGV